LSRPRKIAVTNASVDENKPLHGNTVGDPAPFRSTVRKGQYGPRTMRLLVARCEVLYTGRLTARLPEAVRLLMFKADGSFLVHDDAGGYRPLNWIRSAFRLRRTRAHALVAS
jgi:RecB family endonuclease NucS